MSPETETEVEGALKLQREARQRARAQGLAKKQLTKNHPEEYQRLYQEALDELRRTNAE